MLAYGQPATVPFDDSGDQGVITYANVTVTEGKEEDWTTLGVDTSDAQGEVPWYLKMNVKQEAGGDLTASFPEQRLDAYAPDGDALSIEFGVKDNTLCPNTFLSGGLTVGQSYDTCLVLSVNKGEKVDAVKYELSSYNLDDPYFDKPVVWHG